MSWCWYRSEARFKVCRNRKAKKPRKNDQNSKLFFFFAFSFGDWWRANIAQQHKFPSRVSSVGLTSILRRLGEFSSSFFSVWACSEIVDILAFGWRLSKSSRWKLSRVLGALHHNPMMSDDSCHRRASNHFPSLCWWRRSYRAADMTKHPLLDLRLIIQIFGSLFWMSNVERARESCATEFTRHFVTHLAALYWLGADRKGNSHSVGQVLCVCVSSDEN